MIGGHDVRRRYRLVLLVADLVMIAVALTLATLFRFWLPLKTTPGDLNRLLVPTLPWIGLGWMLALYLGGAYRHRRWGAGLEEYRQVANATVIYVLTIGLGAYLFEYPLSRGFLAILFAISAPLLCLGRLLARRALQHLRSAGRYCTRTLVAGDPGPVADLIGVLRRETWLGYAPVGVATHATGVNEVAGATVVGSPDDILSALQAARAGTVIFTTGSVHRGRDFNEMARTLERHHAEMVVVPALSEISAQRIAVTPVGGLPLMHVGKPQAERSLRYTKRLFDIAASGVLLVLFSPLLLVVSLAIRGQDGGSVLFRQMRVGRGGEPFALLKFRSMVMNAELLRRTELEDQNEVDGQLFKIKDDPRITKLGRFIRRYSIDELPQLVNVLRGEMSLVGPRPALPEEVAGYASHVRRRLDVRPGMTGLWQVSGRSDLSWDDAVRLDLYYVDNWSLLQDIVILFRTVRAVFQASGAY
ncbi:sugar transferase [Aestuariimicrobium ganziense]|uniref:sugar transferase n=1 Tax=Aestuariimicrobium ganziense TaxID=2773677 RepID=UPI002E2AF4C1|nr:sugar transferase [Aestuariimicrobium ganziense]